MAWCFTPIVVYRKGMEPRINPATGAPEWPQVACGSCRACVATRKNDWTGRLAAEAGASKAVYFLTLTYTEEPRDPETGEPVFFYKDIQRMFYLLRAHMKRHHGGGSLRYFVVGERGERKGRIHWHALFFFDRNYSLETPKKGTLWEYWPHGWTKIERVPADDTLRRVRYCSKYAVKGFGDATLCRPRFSTVPALGAKFAIEWAEQLADSRLDMKGTYFLPGHIWTKGKRKGQHIRYRLRGSVARLACHAYLDRWIERGYNKPWASTDFLRFYCPEQLTERILRYPHLRKAFEWNHEKSDLEENFQRWKRIREIRAERPEDRREQIAHDSRQISEKLAVRIPHWQSKLYEAEQEMEMSDGELAAKAEKKRREAEADERAYVEGRLHEPQRLVNQAIIFRRSQVERYLGRRECYPETVERYIATGQVPPEDTEDERLVNRAFWVEGSDYRPENFPDRFEEIQKERQGNEARLRKQIDEIRAASFDQPAPVAAC